MLPRILDAVADTPVVFIQGPRQAGKSTLAKSLLSEGFDATYLTLDDATVLGAAHADPVGFVNGLPRRVILDEVQRAPQLYLAIKRSVDERRLPGRFVLTGSANPMVSPSLSEALVGRMELVNLWPFSQGEIEGTVEQFVDECFADRFQPKTFPKLPWPELAGRIARGGYPEAVARAGVERQREWFAAYVTTILERDVRDIANIHELRDLPRLLRLAAARTAGLLNIADLARDAALAHSTFRRYWSLFEATFLVQTLPAWSTNLTTRLVKSPKVLPVDTGLACYLLGLDGARLAMDDVTSGPMIEAFVAMELIKQSTWSRTHPRIFHYRTQNGHEVDLVLEDARGRIVGIEVRKSAGPGGRDFLGLKRLRERVGSKFLRGFVLHTGSAAVAFADEMFAIPIHTLWNYSAHTPARRKRKRK